jgi:hypothetical protein
MKSLFSTLVVLSVAALGYAGDRGQAQYEAEAALAVAKARASAPAARSLKQHIPYADAYKISKATNKPILVIVGMECKHLCPSLRPDIITANEAKFENDSTPRAILCVPAKDGSIVRVKTWKSLPNEEEVKQAAAEGKQKYGMADMDDATMLASLMMGLVSIQPVWQTGDCPNGQCPNQQPVAVHTVHQQPSYTVNDQVYHDSSVELSTHFVARHPRLAALRTNFRSALKLPAPRVVGDFVQFANYPEAPKQMPRADGPFTVVPEPLNVVGANAAAADDLSAAMQTDTGVRFRAKLKDYKLGERFQILHAARSLKAAEPTKPWIEVLKQLLDLMLEYGPKLIEMLKLFGII